MAIASSRQQPPHTIADTLVALLLGALGRALAFVVVVVVVATAVRGPLPGLTLTPAPDGPGVVFDTVGREPAADHRGPGRSR